jgi:hypothetical protein
MRSFHKPMQCWKKTSSSINPSQINNPDFPSPE